MITVTGIDLSEYNRTVARFSDDLGLDLAQELRQTQIPLLVQELVRQTPPKNVASVARKIESDARRVFWTPPSYWAGKLDAEGSHITKAGKYNLRRRRRSKKFPDTTWLIAMRRQLLGVLNKMFQQDLDARGMREHMPDFRPAKTPVTRTVGQRGRQAVKLVQRIVVSKKNMAAFIRNKVARVGRLKAGWIACADFVGGLKRIPKWVSKHRQQSGAGKLGYFINGLGARNHPTFTIVNTARGAGDLSEIAQKALNWRVKVMTRDIAFRIRTGLRKQRL